MYTLLEKLVGIPKIIFVIVVLRIAPSDGGNIFKPSGPQHPLCMKEFSVAFCNNVVKRITCLAHLSLNVDYFQLSLQSGVGIFTV
jgi:hypothetical protein